MKRRKLFALCTSCLIGTSGLVLGGLTSCGPSMTVESMSISGGNVTLAPGETTNLSLLNQDGTVVTDSVTWSSNLSAVARVDVSSGVVTAVADGTAVITATYGELSTTTTITVETPVDMTKAASGLRSLKREDYATNAESGQINNELLGIQEKYIMEEFLTGIPLVADSSYQMFNPRVVLPVSEYQDLMGFGTPTYIQINGTLSGLDSQTYGQFYHVGTSEDPQQIFSAAADNSSVSNLSSYITLPLWNYKFNDAKNGGELYAVTAKENLPRLMDDEDGDGSGNTFRIYVRTEKDGLYYTYAGSRSNLTGFSVTGNPLYGKSVYTRGVKAEDYLTVLKLALTQKNGLYRGGEMVGDDYTQALKGAQSYYNATASCEGVYNESLWSQVGAQVGSDESGDYIEFTTVKSFTPETFRDSFQGLDYYSPLPIDAVEQIGVSNYGKFSSDRSTSPVDNTVSVGPYTLINWETDSQISFAKNSVYKKLPAEEEMFRIDGVNYKVYTGARSDPELLFNEFLANKLDVVTIPATQLKNYQSDSRTKSIPDEGTWKLNVNACTEETWEELFGVNGTVAAHDVNNYWDVKPIMSNKNFLTGLFFGTNREAIAEATGYTPTLNYFSSVYMGYTYNSDGTRIRWNDTPEHQANLADWYPETYGYNEAAAQIYFERALQEEIAKGNYQRNSDPNNKTKITLTAIWMSQNNITQYGSPFEASVEAIANKAWEKYNFQLDIVNEVAGTSSDDCYNALKAGEFDLGMGAITGYALDPLGLTQIFCSDNRSGFTLNWGPDTSVVDSRLEWNDEYYSFNGFYTACYGGGIYKEGNVVEAVTLEGGDPVESSDRMVYTFTLRAVEGAGIETIRIKQLEIFDPSTYDSFVVVDTGLAEGLAPTVTAEVLSSYKTSSGAAGIYIEYDVVTNEGTLAGQYFQFTVKGFSK